jgi:DNA-binding MarR family transcriptional regulator
MTPTRARTVSREVDVCDLLSGPDGLARAPVEHAEAWTGLLKAHRRLTRELEAALQTRHGLTLSELELLGRLAASKQRRMQIARLAEQIELSLSRTSRIIDTLERRALVQRRSCPEDARATNVQLTPAGLRLTREAQKAHYDEVQRAFLDRLSASQLRTLAAAFKLLTLP